MKKKLLAGLSLAAMLAVSAFGVGCGKTGETSNSGSTDASSTVPAPDSTGGEVPVTPSLTLSAAALSVEIYESATLTAELKNSEAVIEWSSSDETVVKVADGVVTAYKVGTATVTATASELTATCEVTVAAATEAPVFAELPDSMKIIKGLTEELDVTLTYKGNPFTVATVTFATEGDVLSVSEEGVITAVEYGTQEVIVKAFVGAEEVASKTVSVEVIEYAMLIVDLPENTLNITVGGEGYDLSQIQVQLNGAAVDSPVFVGESADDSIATVKEGKIVAVDRGETVVKVSYTAASKNVYETDITVIVSKEVVETDVNFFVRGSSEDVSSAATGTAEITLPDTVDIATLSQVLCGGEAVTFSKEDDKLIFTDAPAGEQAYTLVTATKDYVIEGCIYTNTVSTKDEFLAWRENLGTIKAYTVLTADIDLGGEVLAAVNADLSSVLDGRGHTLSNFTVKTSLVPNVKSTGGFKNLQIVNAVQDCANVTPQMKFGFITQMMYGVVEDVFIMGRLQGIGEDVAHWGLVCYGMNAGARVENVVVQLESDSEQLHYVVGPNGTEGSVKNVHFIFDGPSAKVSAIANENSGIYATADALSKADFSHFSADWTVTAGEVPYMSDYTEALLNATVTLNGKSNLGETLTFETTSFYALKYELAEEATGITVEGNKVIIGDDAEIGFEFMVSVTCAEVNGFGKTFVIEVARPRVNLNVSLLAKGDADLSEANANTGKTVVDMSNAAFDLITVKGIYVGGEKIENCTISGNTLTLYNAPAGDNEYTFVTATVEYVMNICVYNYEISTKADFLAWRDTNVWKYAILTGNIDLENEVLGAAGASTMRGILDGRGYTISNFTVSTGLVTSIAATGGFKNIQFVNVVQNCKGIETESQKAVRYGFLTQTMHGVVENVFIQGRIINVAEGMSHWGMLVYNSGATAVVKNVVMNVVSDCVEANLVINTTAFKEIDNVHLNFRSTDEEYNGKVVVSGSSAAATNCVVYVTDEQLSTADFSLFTGIWTVTAGELPYMSDYTEVLNNTAVTVSGVSDVGATLTFTTTSFYPLTYALSEDCTGISVDGNKVIIGDDAVIGSQFTVVVTCEAIPEFRKEFTYTVDKPIVNMGITLLAKGDAAMNEQNANTGNAALDMSNTPVDLSKVTEVLMNGEAITNYTVSGNVITFANAPAGENAYTFISATSEYTMNICVYNYEIATKADFIAWRNTNVWKYAVLTADIDLENAVLGAAGAGAMRGILDGRGHKISNFTVSTGLVATVQAAGGFKNISFVNATQDCTGIETASVKAVRYGFITQTLSGTIENVSIQGKIVNVAAGMAHWGMLVYNAHATAVIKNVVMDIVSDCVESNLLINTDPIAEFDNVHLNFRSTDASYQGKVVVSGSTAVATNSAVYRTDAELEKADFLLFTGIWTVEAGKLPYMA